MKKKTILGVGLTLMLLGSLLAAAAPVSGATLSWTTVTLPLTTNFQLASGTNVSDIAVFDEDTIFAGDGATYLYKSTDGGATWSSINVDATDNGTDLIAVAPDDEDLIVYVDVDNDKVFLTTNGGSTWGDLGTVTSLDVAHDVAISAEKVGVHYIAIAGVTSSAAEVWYYDYGAAAPAWVQMAAKTGFSTTSADNASAVVFSPNFASDEVLVALIEVDDASTATDNITLEMYSFDSSKWNADAGFTDWPVNVATDDGITDLTTGSITLDPDYLGSDDAMRMAFVGLEVAGDDSEATGKSGIYRVDDTLVKGIKTGTTVDINSVAYNGLNLVAGERGSNVTYYCADPTASTPTVSPTSTYKRVGGSSAVVVAWAGDSVIAASSGAESCFSVSRNDGKSYNDISLIDTALTNLTDVIVSPDGSTIFLATDDDTDTSLFRNASSWERVLTVKNATDFMIRLAPDDADVVYAADKGATTIYYSADSGETRWQLRTCGVLIQDLAVEADGDVSYALRNSDGKVSKSTNSGFTWGTPKYTKLSGGNMIVSLGEDALLIGSDDSYVAYSTDGNDSWTKISKPVVTGGDAVQCIGSGVADDDYVYAAAATAGYIYRWQIGVSAAWDKIYTTAFGVAHALKGITLQGNVLYAVSANTSDSMAYRTTNATLSPTVYWSTMVSTAAFTVTPQALRLSAGSNKLWAINTESTNTLYSYTDTLIDAAPTLNSPKQDFSVKVNPVTGKSSQVTFVWERPSDEVEAYDLKIAFDSGFDETVAGITVTESGAPISQVVGPGAITWFQDPDENYVTGEIEFMPDTTYFWRVRVSSPIKSQYSEVRRFVVEKSTVTPPVTVTIPPAPPTPEIKITVPPPTKIEIPPAPPAPAPITPAYIWAIIIIGAILVIALVVLIIRTRRVV